jgi:hypothetical protein
VKLRKNAAALLEVAAELKTAADKYIGFCLSELSIDYQGNAGGEAAIG